MRQVVPYLVALAVLLPTAAFAADDAKCGQLEIVNQVQMIRAGNLDLVPVTLRATPAKIMSALGHKQSFTLLRAGLGDLWACQRPLRAKSGHSSRHNPN